MGTSSSKSEGSGVVLQQKLKVSDLPLYDEPGPIQNQAYFVQTVPTPFLEKKVSDLRHATSEWWNGAEKIRESIVDTYSIGKAHTENALDLVRDESKGLPRAIFISSGALVGLLFATRRGFFRKILYTGAGAGIPAVICYPKASKELAKACYVYTSDLASNFSTYVDQTINKSEKAEPPLDKKSI